MFGLKEFNEYLLTRLIHTYRNQLTAEETNKEELYRSIWSAQVSRQHFLGITEIVIYYRNKYKGDEERISKALQLLLSGRVKPFNTLLKQYSNPVLLERAFQQDEPLSYIRDEIKGRYNITGEASSYSTYKESLHRQLDQISMFDIDRKEMRTVLATRPFDVRLKRLDTIATFLCPMVLSACVAVSCFSSGWAIASNMNEAENDQILRDILAQRFKKLQEWCVTTERTLQSIPAMPRKQRIAFIVQHVITPEEYQAALGTAGISMELPPDFHLYHRPEERSIYARTVLAKAMDTLCFNPKAFSSAEKAAFLSGPQHIYLPTDAAALVSDKKASAQLKTTHVKSIHAEQLLFLWGERQMILPFNKRVGISKLCCKVCMRVADKMGYTVSGVHQAEYPGVLNLINGNRSYPDLRIEAVTETPAYLCGEDTASDTDDTEKDQKGYVRYPYFYHSPSKKTPAPSGDENEEKQSTAERLSTQP